MNIAGSVGSLRDILLPFLITRLALAVACMLYARRERWIVSGTLAACAAVTRPFGVLLVVPLAIEYLGAVLMAMFAQWYWVG